jgi:hypothetical protein
MEASLAEHRRVYLEEAEAVFDAQTARQANRSTKTNRSYLPRQAEWTVCGASFHIHIHTKLIENK